jgi:hypothetical protein
MQVWAAGPRDCFTFIMFSQVAIYPAARWLELVLAFGSQLETLFPLLDATMEKFARDQNCTTIEMIGRLGWDKKLRPYGAERVGVVMRKRIELERVH